MRKFQQEGERLVELECWGENQRGEKNLEGTSVVRLPSKDPLTNIYFDPKMLRKPPLCKLGPGLPSDGQAASSE